MSEQVFGESPAEALPSPFLSRWEELVRIMESPTEEESRLLTAELRRMVRDLIGDLRRAIDDPMNEDVDWESPYLEVTADYPIDSEVEPGEGVETARRILIEVLSEGKAVFTKDGRTLPLLAEPLLRAISPEAGQEREELLRKWIDLEDWNRPTSFSPDGMQPVIVGRRDGERIDFEAAILVEICPREVNVDEEKIVDRMRVGLQLAGADSPSRWTGQEREKFWKVVDSLLIYLIENESGSPVSIKGYRRLAARNASSELSFSVGFRARESKRDRGEPFLKFQRLNGPLKRIPRYALGLSGSTLDIADGKGRLDPLATLKILAVMLFPDDEDLRRLWLANHQAQAIAELPSFLQEKSSRPEGEGYSGENLRRAFEYHDAELEWLQVSPDLLRDLQQSPPFSDLKKRAQERSIFGQTAGRILETILTCREHHPEHCSVLKAVFLQRRDLSEAKAPSSRSTLLDWWSRFQCVAHLWAASNFGMRDEDFSMSRSELRFLSVAEECRRLGETTFGRAQRAKRGPVLDPAKTWRVPGNLLLPRVFISSNPLSKDALDLLASYPGSSFSG